MPPERAGVGNLRLALLVVGLFFLLLEGLVRVGKVVDDGGPPREDTLAYAVDADLLWRFAPGQHVVQAGHGIEYRINSHGLRGPGFPSGKPEGEARILVVGDSVTFGYRVTEGCDYPARLQRCLAEEGEYGRVRVINAGVNGWSTREELMFLRSEGLSYGPDLVVLGFTLNDASPLARRYQRDMMRRIREGGAGRDGALLEIRALLERSAIVRLLERAIGRVAGGVTASGRAALRAERDRLHHDLMYLRDDRAIEGWNVALEELGETVRLVRGRGLDLALVVFPNRYQVEETPVPDRPQRMLGEFCAGQGVPWLDLLPDFRQAGPDAFIDDVHLTEAGNELAARAIARFLRREGLVPTAGGGKGGIEGGVRIRPGAGQRYQNTQP
jgi:lysophospholipase L1-like esterase